MVIGREEGSDRAASAPIDLLWALGDWPGVLARDPRKLEALPDRSRLLHLMIHAAARLDDRGMLATCLDLSRQWQIPRDATAQAMLSGVAWAVAQKQGLLGQEAEARETLRQALVLLLGEEPSERLLGLRLLEVKAGVAAPPASQGMAENMVHTLVSAPEIRVRESLGMALGDIPVNDADGHGGFALIERDGLVFCGYYDSDRRMVVACRSREGIWSSVVLDQSIRWDSHNYIAMGLDQTGLLHVCGNMHVSPLVYFRSREPFDITTLERVPAMVGTREDRMTYPRFFTMPDAGLCFSYRDGRSGDGVTLINRFDPEDRVWKRLLEAPILDGEGLRNAYVHGPVIGPDGLFHICWVWRQTPDAETCHRLCYARSADLIHWENGSGVDLPVPILYRSPCIVDDVPVGGGMINNNTLIGFDSRNRPLIAYHKFDTHGRTQLFMARPAAGGWVSSRVTDWDWTWDFHGRGSLRFAITIRPPFLLEPGWIAQEYRHDVHGNGTLVIDELNLRTAADIPASLLFPDDPVFQPDTPDAEFRPNVTLAASASGAEVRHLLVWRSRAEKRDRPQAQLEHGSELTYMEVRLGQMKHCRRATGSMPAENFVNNSGDPILSLLTQLKLNMQVAKRRIEAESLRFQDLEDRFRSLRNPRE